MSYFELFILLCFIIPTLVAVFNFVSQPFLNKKKIFSEPLVSVLIPARNEEKNIHFILNDLKQSKYSNLEVIVCDDGSDDGTLSILKDFTRHWAKFSFIRSEDLPSGWVGKNYACYLLSKKASGDFLLFVDADVRLAKNTITKSVAFMQNSKVNLLSIFPSQIIETSGEWKVVPLMNIILLTLLPLKFVQWFSLSAFSAANGQFMMFSAEKYKNKSWHARFKSSYVEDIAIARQLKNENQKIAVLLGADDVRCRMYTNQGDAINGFSKNIKHIFSRSDLFMLFYLLIYTLSIPVMLFLNYQLSILLLLMFLITQWHVAKISRINMIKQGFYCTHQWLSFYKIVFKSFNNRRKGSIIWKGRKITP